jgi:hypothetical protein
MNRGWTDVAIASLAALLPAALGAMLLARVLASDGSWSLAGSMALGIACAVVVMVVARTRGWDIVAGATAISLVGIVLCLLLDAKWNSVDHVARQLMEQHEGLGLANATLQARTIVGGMTFAELTRAQVGLVAGLMLFFAAVGAGFTVRSRLFGRLLRISDRM